MNAAKQLRTLFIIMLTFLSTSVFAQITADSLVSEGNALSKEKKYLEAIAKFDKAILLDSTNELAYFSRMWANYQGINPSPIIAILKDASKVYELTNNLKNQQRLLRPLNIIFTELLWDDEVFKENAQQIINICNLTIDGSTIAESGPNWLGIRALAYLHSDDRVAACDDGYTFYMTFLKPCPEEKKGNCPEGRWWSHLFLLFNENELDCLNDFKEF
jgi:tetratricopeptide (TPR) repeat protein